MATGLAVVTGGSGYIGVNLVPHLLAAGWRVRVVDAVRHRLLPADDVEFVAADVRDADAMAAALAGADVVHHLAAVISVAGDPDGRVRAVNVGGLANVAAQARAAGVGRLVYCGSVHGFDTDVAGPITEASPRAERPALPAYDRSKAAAEVALRSEVARGLDAVVVNPTGIIGPRDPGPSRTGRLLRAMARRRLPAVVEGGFDWVDVRDVVLGLVAAHERGRTGENYLLAGHCRSLRELADDVAAVTGAPATPFTMPLWFARLFAPLATPTAQWSGNVLLYTGDSLHALAAFPHVDDAKARRELGHDPRPLEQTLADLFGWFDSAEGRLAAG